jgi:hypothetical protein
MCRPKSVVWKEQRLFGYFEEGLARLDDFLCEKAHRTDLVVPVEWDRMRCLHTDVSTCRPSNALKRP